MPEAGPRARPTSSATGWRCWRRRRRRRRRPRPGRARRALGRRQDDLAQEWARRGARRRRRRLLPRGRRRHVGRDAARPRRWISSSTGGASTRPARNPGRGEQATWRPYDWDADDGRLGRCHHRRPRAGRHPRRRLQRRGRSSQTSSTCACSWTSPRRPAGTPSPARGQRVPGGVGGTDGARRRTSTSSELMPPDAFDLVLDGQVSEWRQAPSARTSANVRANVCASPGQRADT